MLRGNIMHRLLQSLPNVALNERRTAAANYLARAAAAFPADQRDALLTQALRILNDLRFAPLFTPGSRAEVPIVGRLVNAAGKPILVNGQIDRLVITPDSVLIADYKTNRPAPRRIEEVPQSYVRQLTLYRALLRKIYPGRNVLAALVWTEIPDLMEISSTELDRAYENVTCA